MEAQFAHLIEKGFLHIDARAGKRKTRIVDIVGDVIHVEIAAPAENNRANEELERYLSRRTKQRAKVIVGRSSRKKLVRLGIDS